MTAAITLPLLMFASNATDLACARKEPDRCGSFQTDGWRGMLFSSCIGDPGLLPGARPAAGVVGRAAETKKTGSECRPLQKAQPGKGS
jgi:hypothetical protein